MLPEFRVKNVQPQRRVVSQRTTTITEAGMRALGMQRMVEEPSIEVEAMEYRVDGVKYRIAKVDHTPPEVKALQNRAKTTR